MATNRENRLAVIERWLQQEDDGILYAPDGLPMLPQRGARGQGIRARILRERLARSVFPAIRRGRTRFIYTTRDGTYRVLLPQPCRGSWCAPAYVADECRALDMVLERKIYVGKRRRCAILLAYNAEHDICCVHEHVEMERYPSRAVR